VDFVALLFVGDDENVSEEVSPDFLASNLIGIDPTVLYARRPQKSARCCFRLRPIDKSPVTVRSAKSDAFNIAPSHVLLDTTR
jgi:hypothetical protein